MITKCSGCGWARGNLCANPDPCTSYAKGIPTPPRNLTALPPTCPPPPPKSHPYAVGEPKITIAGALKFDNGKPMLDLLLNGMPDALAGVGAVLTHGFKKYGGKHGWKSLPDAVARYEAAMFRHMLAKARGEKLDPDSGMPHQWHIACNALFLVQLEIDNAKQHD